MPPLALGASSAVLDRLWAVVMSRRDADPAVSHSARLLSRGTSKIAQKFGEEAVECLIEAVGGDVSLGEVDWADAKSVQLAWYKFMKAFAERVKRQKATRSI